MAEPIGGGPVPGAAAAPGTMHGPSRGAWYSRMLGLCIAAVGLVFVLLGIHLGYWYFILHDRILFVRPDLAEEATLDRLLAEPNAFDGRWVRVRGEIWRAQPVSAVLVPAGSGYEGRPVDEMVAFLKDPANKGKEVQVNRALPAKHLNLFCFEGAGMKTLSFGGAAVPADGPAVAATVAGRFHAGAPPQTAPSLGVAAIVEPRQSEYAAAIVLITGFAALALLGGAVCVGVGWWIRKAAIRCGPA
jgi:hypothetical protein